MLDNIHRNVAWLLRDELTDAAINMDLIEFLLDVIGWFVPKDKIKDKRFRLLLSFCLLLAFIIIVYSVYAFFATVLK